MLWRLFTLRSSGQWLFFFAFSLFLSYIYIYIYIRSKHLFDAVANDVKRERSQASINFKHSDIWYFISNKKTVRWSSKDFCKKSTKQAAILTKLNRHCLHDILCTHRHLLQVIQNIVYNHDTTNGVWSSCWSSTRCNEYFKVFHFDIDRIF